MPLALRSILIGALTATLVSFIVPDLLVVLVAFWVGTMFGMMIMGAHILFNKDSDV